MLNRINIDFFANGYSLISGGDCFDLPVATIIGNYKKKLYYYYLAIQVAKKNWQVIDQEWTEYANDSLMLLGFKLASFFVDTWDDFLDIVKECIKQGHPVLVPVSYHKLFYNLEQNDKVAHLIMITGYDEDKQILLVVDSNVVDHGLNLYNKDYTLYQIPLTYIIFQEVWEESYLVFKDKQKSFFNRIFAVKLEEQLFEIPNICFVMKDIYNHEDSALIRVIDMILNEDVTKENKINFDLIRRTTVRQMAVMFDVLQEAAKNEKKLKELKMIRHNTFLVRESIINRLEINYRKGVLPSAESVAKMKLKISRNEAEIFSWLE